MQAARRTESAMSHSPTPWQIQDGHNHTRIIVTTNDELPMLIADAIDPVNAAHIVRCVNTFDELVAALCGMEDLVSAWISGPIFERITFSDGSPPALYAARAELAKVQP